MSIIICSRCERYVDSDINDTYDVNDQMICECCYEEVELEDEN